MDEVVSLAIAAGQLEAARQAVWASWAGAAANAAVVAVTVKLALQSQKEIKELRAEARHAAHWTAAIAITSVYSGFYDAVEGDQDQPVDWEMMSEAFDHALEELGRANTAKADDKIQENLILLGAGARTGRALVKTARAENPKMSRAAFVDAYGIAKFAEELVNLGAKIDVVRKVHGLKPMNLDTFKDRMVARRAKH